MLLQTKLTSWAQRDTTLQENINSQTGRKWLSCSDPETLWTKIKDLKVLLVETQERALHFERGQRKCSCIRGQIFATRISKATGNQ